MSQTALVQVILATSILLVVLFGAMLVISLLASAGRIRLPHRTSNRPFVASMLSLVAGLLLMLSTALL
jgi:hypothetical protein